MTHLNSLLQDPREHINLVLTPTFLSQILLSLMMKLMSKVHLHQHPMAMARVGVRAMVMVKWATIRMCLWLG
jgi:hypothetical protein